MDFSLYVDPSEMKNDSQFKKCKGIGELKPISLPGLEEMTGADIIISPPNLPKPSNKFLLKMHLEKGALLVQLKFGFDLIASVVDGRLPHSQAKMLATGASSNQIILLFIGLLFEPTVSEADLMLILNGQIVSKVISQAKNLKFPHYIKQRLLWEQRGGLFENIIFLENVKMWIENAASVAFESKSVKQVWHPKQELLLIDDWRNLLANLPGLGEKKANDIYNWLEDKSFYGFMAALKDESIKDVPGIGAGIISKIKEYLKG